MNAAGGFLAWVVLLLAVHANDHNVAKQLKDTGDIMPLATILNTIRTTHLGQVLEVELQHQHGGPVYRVELVDAQGVVWYLRFDATRGTLLHRHKEKEP